MYKFKDKEKYFCSELIVECLQSVGFIEDSAAIIYKSNKTTPIDLSKDATFGVFAGYLSLNNGDYIIPKDDEFYESVTFNEIYG